MSSNAAKMRAARRTWCDDAWVRPLLRRYRRAFAASLALAVLPFALGAALMFWAGHLIADAAEQPELGLFSLLVPLGLVQLFGVTRPFASYLERLQSHDWVLRISSSLRAKLFGATVEHGFFWSCGKRAGEVLDLLSDDLGHIQDLFLKSILPMACAWALWIVVSVLFGLASLPFACLMALGLLLLVTLVPAWAALAGKACIERERAASRALYEQLADDVAGLADWDYAGRGAEFVAKQDAAARACDELARAKANSRQRFELASNLIFALLAALALGWACLHFQDASIAGAGQAGRVQDLIAAVVLGLLPLVEAFSALPGAAIGAIERADSLERLNTFGEGAAPQAREEIGHRTPAEPSAQACSLDFDNVHFAYPDGTEVLHDIDLHIAPGEKIAILGASGTGKSTLLALARGDLAPQRGDVAVDGMPTASLGDAASRWVSFIEQAPHVFDDSFYGNVALGDASITRDQVAAALEAVGLGQLVEARGGLDAPCGEAASLLSGGQAHRVAFARALVRDTPLVILDEPGCGLDPVTEHALLATLHEAFAQRTVVMVTHHVLGLEAFDRVVLMEDGRIAFDGEAAAFTP